MNRLSLSLVALSLGLATWLAPREARACSCVPPPPPEVALERASAVFVGEVRATAAKGDLRREITLEVSRAFKGVEGGQVALLTPMSSAACGRHFEEGKRYLVYAERIEGVLYDNLCTRTAPVEDAKHDLAVLEALARGEKPPPEPKPAVGPPGGEPNPPPSGAAEPEEEPALEQGPSTQPSPPSPSERQPPGDAPAGHCASVAASLGGPLLPLALLGLCLLPGARLRRRARRRMSP